MSVRRPVVERESPYQRQVGYGLAVNPYTTTQGFVSVESPCGELVIPEGDFGFILLQENYEPLLLEDGNQILL